MKGIVFTEFLEMVEVEFGINVVDDIIDASNLPSQGSYTTVGTYDHAEMLELVTHLSATINVPIPDLLRSYGNYLFSRFFAHYPDFFSGKANAFDFLESVENYIHVEVKKLYPDADLPKFDCSHVDKNTMIMIYNSTKPFAIFAEGLILGCIKHFNEQIDVVRDDLTADFTSAKFTLTKKTL